MRSLANVSRRAVVQEDAPDYYMSVIDHRGAGIQKKWGEMRQPYPPCVGERNHVVNVHVGRVGPGRAVVWRAPCARGRGAGGGALHDVGAVAGEHDFAGVAGSADGRPVGEEVAGVARRRAGGADSQAVELGLGGGGGRDAWLVIMLAMPVWTYVGLPDAGLCRDP